MKTRIVVLAAGKGKRMGIEIPKVLVPLKGEPVLYHILRSVRQAGIDPRPIVVVGENKPLIETALAAGGFAADYAIQQEQLGTGHAVRAAQFAAGDAESVLVLYGDHPFVSPLTIKKIISLHETTHATLTLATLVVPDFEGWRVSFADFGRIIRSANGEIERIVEKKDGTPSELAVRELNPAFFCFSGAWLWQSLAKLKNANAQGEFYLTDLVKMALEGGVKISSLVIDA
ncbi:MAG: NTP transferase domain-containing protein, partial [bacterium]|nr:NTP transferase domain-containing protein [bacterium]